MSKPEPRVGVEPKPESEAPPLAVEVSPSGRSTCRVSGEKIGKGDPRIVAEAYIVGRMAKMYAAVKPFLEGCRVEVCTKANSGICKQTKHKFEKGEVRFVAPMSDKKKIFLSPAAAAELLPPAIEACPGWQPTDVQGLDTLNSKQVAEFCRAFKVDKKKAAELEAAAPSPDEAGGDAVDKPPPRKRQKKEPKAAKEPAAEAASNKAAEGDAPAAEAAADEDKDAAEGKKEASGKKLAAKKAAAKQPAAKKAVEKKTAEKKPAKRGKKRAKEDEEGEEAEGQEAAEGADEAAAAADDEPDVKEEDGEEVPAGGDVAAEEASPERAPPPVAIPPGSPANDYEKVRREQIQRNLERMQQLNVVGAAVKVAPPKREKPPKARGLPARKRVKEDPGPRRQSLRQQGVAADGTRIDHEKRNGEVVLVNGEAIRYGAGQAGGAWEAPPPRDRHPKGPVEFRSSNGGRGTDARFVRLLAMQTAATTAAGGSRAKGVQAPGRTQCSELLDVSLAEEDVAKVTRDGVVHMAFHPRSDAIILAAGDKGGRVGLWQLDHESFEVPEASPATPAQASSAPQGGRRGRSRGADDTDAAEPDASKEAASAPEPPSAEDEDGGGDDGVLELTPHYQYISGLRWVGGAGLAARLLTVSYDGSLRCLDPGAGCTFQLLRSEEGAEYSAMDATANGNTAYLADKDGALEVVDTRQAADAKPAAEISLHEKKINTLSLEPSSEQLLATSVGDGTVAVWDTRKLSQGAKPVATGGHTYSCQAAYFAPDGSQRIVSTSRDNTLQIWDARKGLAPGPVMKHNNNTGRWISPFRAVWTPASDGIVVGNMGRQVDIFDEKGSQAAALSSELMTAIPSRCCVHASLPLLAAATASGRMHVYR